MKYAKYSKALAKKICEIISTGKHSISDTCTMVGIGDSTFYYWRAKKPEFATMLQEAEAERLEHYKEMAISGLAKLLDVHEYDEVTVEYEDDKKGKPKIKSKKIIKKKIMPNPTAIIFTLTNRDNDNWKNRQNTDITSKGEKIEVSSPFMQVIMEASKKEDGNGN